MATEHPLDHEEIRVTVLLEHVATRVTVTETVVTPADGPPTVRAAAWAALEHAMDDLLAEIEVQGGG